MPNCIALTITCFSCIAHVIVTYSLYFLLNVSLICTLFSIVPCSLNLSQKKSIFNLCILLYTFYWKTEFFLGMWGQCDLTHISIFLFHSSLHVFLNFLSILQPMLFFVVLIYPVLTYFLKMYF